MKRILYTDAITGNLSIVCPAPGVDWADVLKAVPAGIDYEEVATEEVPSDRTFRDAWMHDKTSAPEKVAVRMDIAKEITHERRRAKRLEEFAPLDIKATIPAEAAKAESERQAIRTRHAKIQDDIDACTDAVALKAIIDAEGI